MYCLSIMTTEFSQHLFILIVIIIVVIIFRLSKFIYTNSNYNSCYYI